MSFFLSINPKKSSLCLLIIIFAIALFLRLYKLDEFPVGLHGDEASIGYNAYSLLNTLRDQNGNFLPIAINQFGDFRPAGYHYIDIPFVYLLGLNSLAVRLPAALFGSAEVIILYFLLFSLFEKRSIALLGAFSLAILPWDINISRASSESVIATFFLTFGIYLFIKGIKKENFSITPFVLSGLLFFLSFFFYHATRYFLPLFFPILFLLIYFFYKPSKSKIFSSAVLYAILVLGVIFFFTLGKGTGRVSEVSIFNIPGGIAQLKQAQDEEGTLNPLLTRFYDNKLFFYGRFFLTFYSEHLSGDFLFVNTGLPARYKIPLSGNLFIIEAPFLILGFVFLFFKGVKEKKSLFLIPIAWFFLAPVPAGLTWEDIPNVVRSSLMIPALCMVIAYGVYELFLIVNNRWKKPLIIILFFVLIQNFLYFYHNYFWRLKVHEPWNRSASEQDLIYNLINLSKQYSKVVMTTQNNNNLIFYLFYTKYNPSLFQKLGSPVEKDGLKFDNFIYTYSDCPITGEPDKNAEGNNDKLFVNKPGCVLPKNAEVLSTIRTPDNSPSFEIIKLKKT